MSEPIPYSTYSTQHLTRHSTQDSTQCSSVQYSLVSLPAWDTASSDVTFDVAFCTNVTSDIAASASESTFGQVPQPVAGQAFEQSFEQSFQRGAEKLTEGLVEGNEGAVREVGREIGASSCELENWSEQAEDAEVSTGIGDRLGKKKVTYYLSESLQNQLKVRATIERQAMSEVVEQALRFYLEHGDLVQRDGVGHTHRLYACPACQSMLMFRHGNLQSVPKALESGTLLQE